MADAADIQAQIDELRAQLEDLASTFDAAAFGQEGREGQEGEHGSEGEGKEGEAGGEVNSNGEVVNPNDYEVNENGEVTPPPSESAIEKKGGITKKNLKAEAEKEGIGGLVLPEKYDNTVHKGEILSAAGVSTPLEYTPSALKDAFVTILIRASAGFNEKATVKVVVDVGGTLAHESVWEKPKFTEGNEVFAMTMSLIVPKGQKVKILTTSHEGKISVQAEQVGQLTLD